jgi:endoglucanase
VQYPFAIAVICTIAVTGCAATGHDARFTYDQGAIIRGDATQKRLALIFTGGDQGQATGTILDILARHDVRASFFVTGGYLAVDEQRAQVARMIAEGHYVGPHSDAHLLYCSWEDRSRTLVSRQLFAKDLHKNIADLRALGCLGGDTPNTRTTVNFIPPYEWYNAEQVRWARALGVCMFNFTPGSGSNRDWIPESDPRFVSSAQIVTDVLAYEQRDPAGLKGFLLLFHLGSKRQDLMDNELDHLITRLLARGYSFARVDELLATDSAD